MNNMKIRVCLTNQCNFSCKYCRPGGEGNCSNNNDLSNSELIDILKILLENGFESVRLTGGEPLLRKDFFGLISQIQNLPHLKKMTMVTNGSLLDEDKIKKLKEFNFKSVTVSLDSICEEEFLTLTGRNCANKVIKNILLMKKQGINVKVNAVISRYNSKNIRKLIEFCANNSLPLKLLDLVGMESNYWQKEYIPLHDIESYLKEISDKFVVQYQDEGFGTPEHVYYYKQIPIVIKDSTLGTCYARECLNCNMYPCQSGIVSMILTSTGFLKFCSLTDNYNVDLKNLLKNDINTLQQLHNLIRDYNTSTFSREWSNKVYNVYRKEAI